MSLPTLKLPTHKITLPFSKKELEIRPYIIKEEGSILTMLEGKKEVDKDVTEVYKRIIDNCVITENFETSKLNMYDFFFLVIHIRMKSNGEVVEGVSKCEECGKQCEFDINLEDAIQISSEKNINSIIKINKDLAVELVTPTIDEVLGLSKVQKNDVDYTLNFVAYSIKKVIYNEKIYTDFTDEELIENILDNLTKKDFKKITTGIELLAKLILKFEFTCPHCSHLNKKTVENVMDFF